MFRPISDELEVSRKGNGSVVVIYYFKGPLQTADIKVLAFGCNLSGHKKFDSFRRYTSANKRRIFGSGVDV